MRPPAGLEAKEAAGWPPQPELFVPEDVREDFDRQIERRKIARAEADRREAAWRRAYPQRAAGWDAARERKLPADLAELLSEGMAGVASPTRVHSATVLGRLAKPVPYLVGGSADLAGSGAPPVLKDGGTIGPGAEDGADAFAGRNIFFGVREHAMAAITNGMALDGTFIAYSGTFLIFSDYMRPSIRLAALMKLRSIFVFTHDSIFVGEDGPTHQPIEQLDGLRSIPGLRLFRPADGVETAMVWAWILEKAEGPSLLALTRHEVPGIAREAGFDRYDIWRGAYVVRESVGPPQVVLLASGSEVSLAIQAAEALGAKGTSVRVVSVPCQELFAEQSDAYQRALVPEDGPLLVAVEAGRAQSYRRWVGRRGVIYGMDTFGASGNYEALAKHFGFDRDALVARIEQELP
jgi:transketolase